MARALFHGSVKPVEIEIIDISKGAEHLLVVRVVTQGSHECDIHSQTTLHRLAEPESTGLCLSMIRAMPSSVLRSGLRAGRPKW